MKKAIVAFVALFVLTTLSLSAAGPFSKDKSDLNVGVGFGTILVGTSVIPPISASYEIGYPDDSADFLKKLSIGGFLGFGTTENVWSWGTYSYTHIIIGARGSYHFYNEGNMDLYGGVMVGYNIVSSSYESNYSGSSHSSAAGSTITYSLHVGGRYYFSESIGAFVELGYGIAFINVGLTMKF